MTSSFILTNSQKKAIDAFQSGRNVFLSGEAGTGKSFVLNYYLSGILRKNIIVCAPTGIAALNVGGVTMHRAFAIPTYPLGPKEEPEQISKGLLRADIIVIDEISMARFDAFQYVAKSIRMAEKESGKPKQLILIGDFFQLPPVITDKDRKILETMWGRHMVRDGFAFQAPLWESFDFVNIMLTDSMRQRDDQPFLDCLNQLRKGNPDCINWLNRNACKSDVPGIKICPRNRDVERINATESDKLEGTYSVFKSTVYGKVLPTDKPAPDCLNLKVGMQIMTVVNNANVFQNGSIGIISAIDKEASTITVEFPNGKEAEIAPFVWKIKDYCLNEDNELETKVVGVYTQLPIKVAYAITIHKSQGKTFKSASLNPACFAPGQLYVAVSRLTSITGLHLSKKILSSYLKTSNDVLEFYRSVA